MQHVVFPRSLLLLALVCLMSAVSASAEPLLSGDVIINEFAAAQSDRLLRSQRFGGMTAPRPGWLDIEFQDSAWPQGPGGLGFGDGDDATDVGGAMEGVTPSLYIRRSFTVSVPDAARGENLRLILDYDDGFIAYLNGVEVARRNCGATGEFFAFDDEATGSHEATASAGGSSLTLTLGPASNFLQAGQNVLAIQAHNVSVNSVDLSMIADLEIATAATTRLVSHGDTWRYFVGTQQPLLPVAAEPSRALVLGMGTPWIDPGFDDAEWVERTGGFDGTGLAGSSLYTRHAFSVSAGEAASPDVLALRMAYKGGFVAYLNGQEVARRNTGSFGGFVYYDQPAYNDYATSGAETWALRPAADLLVPGQNVLAIQLHQHLDQALSPFLLGASLFPNESSATTFVSTDEPFRFFVGVREPSGGLADEDDEFQDWIELYNRGTTAVALEAWALTDDRGNWNKWRFPASATIEPGGYLVVFASGKDRDIPVLHTDFRLEGSGEYLALYDSAGGLRTEFSTVFPEQRFNLTYGRFGSGETFRYLPDPTPGGPNGAPADALLAIAETPVFSVEHGVFATSFFLQLTSDTPGADIYYTLDGSEPTTYGATLYSSLIRIGQPSAVRARAFASGLVPSAIATQSYILSASDVTRMLPIVSLAGDAARSLFQPHGTAAIVGGNYDGGPWQPNGPDDYNNCTMRGRFIERPTSVELFHADATPGFQLDCGIRVAGSNFSRFRYVQDGKFSLRLYLRSDYGPDTLDYPLFDGPTPGVPSDVTEFQRIVLRSGRDDAWNPFIKDELLRRLSIDMGMVGSHGTFAHLYANGKYQGFYNPVERIDENFLAAWYDSNNEWDVIHIGELQSGTWQRWDEIENLLDTLDFTQFASYVELSGKLDIENLIDYLLANIYGATWDWPENNWTAAREHTETGLMRFYVWDAEGAFRLDRIDRNVIEEDLLVSTELFCVAFRKLLVNPDFRQFVRDRIQMQFLDGGPFGPENILLRFGQLKSVMQPVIEGIGTVPFSTEIADEWVPNRPAFMFAHFQAAGLWDPDTLAPILSRAGGTVPAGTALDITNPNATGTLYYTINGTDPREPGTGVVSASASTYQGTITIQSSSHVVARVLNGASWSPVAHAAFVVPSEPANLVVSELMYHAAAGSDYDYIELHNASADTAADLSGAVFTNGIDFTFPTPTTIAPGGYLLVVRANPAGNFAGFRTVYGLDASVPIVGPHDGKFSNGGEQVTLRQTPLGSPILSFAYSDGRDWPLSADGTGHSLVPRRIADQPEGALNYGGNWRASAFLGGSPGTAVVGPAPTVLLNEIMAHTDFNSPSYPDYDSNDWIELINPAGPPVNMNNWYLSDDPENLTKWPIPGDVTLATGERMVFDEVAGFHSPITSGFGINKAGEQIYLTYLPGDGTNRVADAIAFKGQENGSSLARYPDGWGYWRDLCDPTPGAPNTQPTGGLRIAQIHYHPPDTLAHPIDNTFDEFILLQNTGAATADLWTDAGTWRLAGEVDFDFPAAVSVAAGEKVLLVNFDPTVPGLLDQFRADLTAASLPAQVYGPYAGNISNQGGRVAIERPQLGDLNDFGLLDPPNWVVVDETWFFDQYPWTSFADGTGLALGRTDLAHSARSPFNWTAASPAVGPPTAAFSVVQRLAIEHTGQSGIFTWYFGFSASAWAGPFDDDYAIDFTLAPSSWVGLYLYDYQSAAWTHAAYPFRQPW